MRQVGLFIMLCAVWFLLTCPVSCVSGDVEYHAQDIWTGALVALLVTLVMRDVASEGAWSWLSPSRYFWLIVYACVLVYYIIKANFDVTYRLLHPAMPIHPGIVKVKTSLQSPRAITVLCNSITLTPGTLTVSASEDGVLYVHWINVTEEDEEGATKRIASRFEWFIKRIFD